jgi:hypothetical protein
MSSWKLVAFGFFAAIIAVASITLGIASIRLGQAGYGALAILIGLSCGAAAGVIISEAWGGRR